MNFKEVGERHGNFPFCQVSHQILLFIPLHVDFLELIAIYQVTQVACIPTVKTNLIPYLHLSIYHESLKKGYFGKL